jgi:hypothetical protein
MKLADSAAMELGLKGLPCFASVKFVEAKYQ